MSKHDREGNTMTTKRFIERFAMTPSYDEVTA